jgi:hypothetical protein
MMRNRLAIHLSRRVLAVTAATGVVAAMGLTVAAVATAAPASHTFSFALKPSAGIRACLPHAGGRVTITTGSLNDKMTISVHGMPRRTGFDLFVIQLPTKPFGVSWYQTDVNVGRRGTGIATVRGIFDSETFSVSPGGTTTFGPTHQYHLGLWFNNPRVPFRLGCEPGAAVPVVTPFNGRQHAGIQVLNTAQFPANRGPLSHVHR